MLHILGLALPHTHFTLCSAFFFSIRHDIMMPETNKVSVPKDVYISELWAHIAASGAK